MKFTLKTSQRGGELFQLTAMVDVVFILLSFFILAAEFTAPERDFAAAYRDSTPPRNTASRDLPDFVPVRLTREDGGKGVVIQMAAARLKTNDFDGIRRKLREINLPRLDVRIMADPALSVDQVAKALDAVLASPMKNVSVSKLPVATSGRKVKPS